MRATGLLIDLGNVWSKVASNFHIIKMLKVLGFALKRDSLLLKSLYYSAALVLICKVQICCFLLKGTNDRAGYSISEETFIA